jgi:hypothetical protein
MNPFKFIKLHIFLLSFVFGLFTVYVIMPEEKNIFVYPTPENVNKLQYRDNSNTCFDIRQEEVNCNDYNKIEKIPMQ